MVESGVSRIVVQVRGLMWRTPLACRVGLSSPAYGGLLSRPRWLNTGELEICRADEARLKDYYG